MDLLCLMFGAPNRGVLASGGLAWSDQEIAERVGGPIGTNLEYLAELLAKGVACRNEQSAIFSRRLVRDEQERKASAERMRKHRIVTPPVTVIVADNVMPLSVTANGSATEEEIYKPSKSDELIERVVRLHPSNSHLKNALQLPQAQLELVMRAIIRDGPELVEQGTRFCAEVAEKYPQARRKMIPGPAKFWGLEAHYLKGRDYWNDYLAGENGAAEQDPERCERCGGPKWLPSKLTPNKVRECDCKPVSV